MHTGLNLGCMMANPTGEFPTTYTSQLNTTQITSVRYDLGILTNTGMTQRKGTYNEEDDVIIVQLQFKMADALEAEHETEFMISVGAQIGDVIPVIRRSFRVIRDTTEVSDIVTSVTVDNTTPYTLSVPCVTS